MMIASTNGRSTSRAHTSSASTSAALTARKITRSRVQPPGRKIVSRELTGVVTKPSKRDRARDPARSAFVLGRCVRRRRGLRGRLLDALELFLQHVAERRALAGTLALERLHLLGLGAFARGAHGERDAAIDRVDVGDLGLHLVALVELGTARHLARRNETLDTLDDAHERAEVRHAENRHVLDHRAGTVFFLDLVPRVVPELL